ncbi:MAG: MoxR family ATPase [Cyanobacteria bacterium REEB459]|nr:MoxR family ATPase [Cyanobacteria bacterium REEB459]
MRDRIETLLQTLNHTIIGKSEAIRLVLVALFSGGHALLEDVPGVGKTLLARSLAQSIDGRFQRLQCTPDLLPADITGTNIWNPGQGDFQFLPGPVFANILLIDEINRATPRTQSALLEVMEEDQVTIDGLSRPVPQPFFAIATQNPAEYHGTFPLPEAQLDRFALCLSLGYPSQTEEIQMVEGLGLTPGTHPLHPCLSLGEVLEIRRQCSQVRLEASLQQYLVQLVRATRSHPDIGLGVSPRGTLAFGRAVQALAYLQGRTYAIPDDIKALTLPVLAHRLVTNGSSPAQAILEDLLATTPIP